MEQEQEAPETASEAPEAALEAPAPGADAPLEGESPRGDDSEAPEGGGQAPAEDGEVAEAPVRPREVIKGIHPELVCECPECDPEFTELQWFSPEEERKTKGSVMLYCQRSSRKYFSPATEFHAWVAENATKKRRKD